MEERKKRQQRAERAVWVLLLALLIFWSLPLAGKGIDVRDTGSYLTKYRYIFRPDIKVNELHYFLGEVAGGIIYALTPVRKVLALNIASSVLYTVSALLLYCGLKRYLPRVPLLASVLVGTFYGITWIRTLNWNAWTSLWLTAGLLLLLAGLEKNSQKFLGASGFVLAVNTYFRMPNMLFLALIAVIFWNEVLMILEEEQCRIRELLNGRYFWRAVKSCRWFFAGAVLGAAAGLALALCILGPETVLGDLSMLTSVGAGENEGNTHSITTGIYLFLLGMRDGAVLWVKYGVLLAALWAAALGIRRAQKGPEQGRTKDGLGPEKDRVSRGTGGRKLCGMDTLLTGISVLLSGLLGLWSGFSKDVLAAHEWVAFGAVAFGIAGAFYYGKKDRGLSCLCAAAVIIEGFLTIGTDTGVNFYRVYMGLPLALLLILFYRRGNEAGEEGKRGIRLLLLLTAVFTFFFAAAAGGRYAATHVYHDAPNEELDTEINCSIYEGIYTSGERAQSLNRLMEELAPYKEDKLLQIGCFNIGCVLTDMEPFYDSSWPDLEYLPMKEFETVLEEALERGEYPVLLLGTAEESGMNWSPGKFARIRELGESSLYRTLYVDELYTIYVPAEGVE